jgi:regulator of replication initiation timing
MKIIANILFIGFLIIVSCNNKSGTHSHHEKETANNSPNQALYDQVMAVHDEVMPKTGEIYQLKKELQEKVAKSPDLAVEKKKQLDQIITELDSADHLMMDWMHKFDPLPDSVNQEAAREYLENEMEKIKKVRELINGTIQKAKDEIGKK